MKRVQWLDNVERRDLSHCNAKLKSRGVHERSILRRQELVKDLRAKRNLPIGEEFTLSGTEYGLLIRNRSTNS